MKKTNKQILKNAKGQTLVEYGLIVVLIAIVVVAMLLGTGQTINNSYYSKINSAMERTQ